MIFYDVKGVSKRLGWTAERERRSRRMEATHREGGTDDEVAGWWEMRQKSAYPLDGVLINLPCVYEKEVCLPAWWCSDQPPVCLSAMASSTHCESARWPPIAPACTALVHHQAVAPPAGPACGAVVQLAGAAEMSAAWQPRGQTCNIWRRYLTLLRDGRVLWKHMTGRGWQHE